VTTIIEREKELQKIPKSLRDLFERCFTSNVFEAKEHQRITELAANPGVPRKKIKEVEPFFKKRNRLLALQTELCRSIRPLRTKNIRKINKKLKRQLEIVVAINLILIETVEQYWCYLPCKQRENFEELTTSLALLKPDILVEGLLNDKKNSGYLPPFKKVYFHLFKTASKLINAVVDADDPDDADCDELLKFLNFINQDIENNPCDLVPYTEEMNSELNQLLKGI
jgi:hypothetical protein